MVRVWVWVSRPARPQAPMRAGRRQPPVRQQASACDGGLSAGFVGAGTAAVAGFAGSAGFGVAAAGGGADAAGAGAAAAGGWSRRGGRRFAGQLDCADGGAAAARQGGFVLLQALERLGPARRHARAFRHEVGAAIGADRVLFGLARLLRVSGQCRARGQSRQYKIRPNARHFSSLHNFLKDAENSVIVAFVTARKCPYLYEHHPNAVDRFDLKDPRHANGRRRNREAHQEPHS